MRRLGWNFCSYLGLCDVSIMSNYIKRFANDAAMCLETSLPEKIDSLPIATRSISDLGYFYLVVIWPILVKLLLEMRKLIKNSQDLGLWVWES